MGKLLRRMKWFHSSQSTEEVDWQQYQQWLSKEREREEGTESITDGGVTR